MVRALLLIILSVTTSALMAQSPDYPKDYFRNPLSIPILLSGNFGEMRTNHYHMGLDMKTNARENLPIHAAAEGYVSRIKVEPGGFGRAIYIDHPNGYTTLYAHLNAFSPKLEEYLEKQQYEQESWRVTLIVPPGVLPVKKGEFIANSGNTGGSAGPHLHFEIRRTADDVNLNPLLFGFPIRDNVRPRLVRLSMYDRTRSIYEQNARVFGLKALAAGKYGTTPALIKSSSPLVSFAFTGYDSHTGSANMNGIYQARLLVNGEEHTGFLMDNISYNDTRYLNAHIDYSYKASGNPFLQHLSELPGYVNSIYRHKKGNGVLDISDGRVYAIQIDTRDTHGNSSVIEFNVQYSGNHQPASPPPGKKFYPRMLDGFEAPECEYFIPEAGVYDSVHIAYSQGATEAGAVSATHTIGSPLVPLQEAMMIRIKADKALSETEKNRTLMQWRSGSRKAVQKVEWFDDWAMAKFRDFGSFRLLVDTVPPVIVPSGFSNGANLSKATRIVFSVRDDQGQYKNVRTELNGKWIRFTNDKSRLFIYRFDERCPRGKNTLTISAEDEAGNTVTETYSFTR